MLNEPLSYLSRVGRPTGGLERVLVPGQLAEQLVGADGRRVSADVLDRSGVTASQAFVHGRRRRQRQRRGIIRTAHHAVPAILMMATEAGDAASWLPHLRDIVRPFPVHGCLAVAPSPCMLMVLPMVDITSVGWLDVLVHAGRNAYQQSQHPLCPHLLWVHPGGIDAFHGHATRTEVSLVPPDGFPEAVQRLAQRAMRTVDAVA